MKPWVARAVSSGRAMAMFLGTISPKIIVSTVPRASADAERDRRRRRRSGSAGGGERSVDQLGDRRLGEETDGQVGDGDADLGAGELGRQRAERELHALGARVTAGGGPLDLRRGRRSRRRTRRRRTGRRRPRAASEIPSRIHSVMSALHSGWRASDYAGRPWRSRQPLSLGVMTVRQPNGCPHAESTRRRPAHPEQVMPWTGAAPTIGE